MTRLAISPFKLRSAIWVHVLFVAMMLAFAGPANGQAIQDTKATDTVSPDAAIDVVVTAVQGSTIQTQGGFEIDLSKAIITSVGGKTLDPIAIQNGMRIRATIDTSASPFVAKFAQVRLDTDILLAGPIQSVEGGFITVLNRRISIGEALVFVTGRVKLKVGRDITVVAVLNGTELVARQMSQSGPTGLIALGFL